MESHFSRVPCATEARRVATLVALSGTLLACGPQGPSEVCDPTNDPPTLVAFDVLTDTVDIRTNDDDLIAVITLQDWIIHPTYGSLVTLTATSPSGAQVARLDLRPGPQAGQYRFIVRRGTETGMWQIEDASVPYLHTICRDETGGNTLYANALTLGRTALGAFGDPLQFVVVGPTSP
jgi:hypothetical protein